MGHSYCANDRVDAIKLGRIYLSGLARIVWQSDDQTSARREVYHSYTQSVIDATRARQRLRGFLIEHCLRPPKERTHNLRLRRPYSSGLQDLRIRPYNFPANFSTATTPATIPGSAVPTAINRMAFLSN